MFIELNTEKYKKTTSFKNVIMVLKKLKLTPGEINYLKSKRIGLVLSGGASRGFAEAGVMSVFQKHSIEPVAIAATSVGSLVGTCIAARKSIDLLTNEFTEKNLITWRDISLRNAGLIKGDHIVKKVLDVLNVNDFKDLYIPLVVSATSLTTGKEKIFIKGKLLPILSASIAFPGMITPKKIGREILVDGGVTTPVPVHLLPKDLDLVIVVDVTGKLRKLEYESSSISHLRNVYEIMLHHLTNRDIEKAKIEWNMIIIKPPVDTYRLFNFSAKNAKAMMKTGDKTARVALKKGIRALKAKEKKLAQQESL